MVEEAKGASSRTPVEFLVAAPILHLLVTGLFLLGYYVSFGNRVYAFATSSDLFVASMGNVGLNYISLLTFPVIFILWLRGKSGAWSVHDAAMTRPEGEERIEALKIADLDRNLLKYLGFIIVFTQIVSTYIQYHRDGYIPYYSVSFFVIALFAIFVSWLANRMTFPTPSVHVTILLGLMLIGSFFNGMSSGQADRRLDYSEAIKVSVQCPLGAILRPVGEHFLIVGPNNQHVIADRECKLTGKIAG